MINHNNTPPAFSLRAGSSYLGIGESTLRRWIAEHRVPRVKLGGRVLVMKTDLDALLSACRQFHPGGRARVASRR